MDRQGRSAVKRLWCQGPAKVAIGIVFGAISTLGILFAIAFGFPKVESRKLAERSRQFEQFIAWAAPAHSKDLGTTARPIHLWKAASLAELTKRCLADRKKAAQYFPDLSESDTVEFWVRVFPVADSLFFNVSFVHPIGCSCENYSEFLLAFVDSAGNPMRYSLRVMHPILLLESGEIGHAKEELEPEKLNLTSTP